MIKPSAQRFSRMIQPIIIALNTGMRLAEILTLKELLGHTSLRMVQRYAHLSNAHKAAQIDRLVDVFQSRHIHDTS